MSTKKRVRGNFRQAMSELVNGEAPKDDGISDMTEETSAELSAMAETQESDELEILHLEEEEPAAPESPDLFMPSLEPEQPEDIEVTIQEEAEVEMEQQHYDNGVGRSESIITEDMIIEGNIITQSDLKIYGTITGNVTCEGNVFMTGAVEGEVSVDSLKMESGNIVGNVHSNKDLMVEQGAKVKGDISCQSMVMNGQVEGSIVASESIELKEAAILIGNATSGNISVHNGAKVKGLIQIGEV